jgi:lysophospholipase L1-like esterase
VKLGIRGGVAYGSLCATVMVLLLGQHFVLPKMARPAPAGIEAGMGFWVASWATSVQPGGDAPIWIKVGFENRTLRMILHPSTGGNRIRLRICNTYGKWPLIVGKVRIAIKSSGSNIRQETIRIVTFGGDRSTRIAAGAMTLTDPIPLKVSAEQDLAVDLYLPLPTGPPTWHALSDLDSYISSPGDYGGAESWQQFTVVHSWFFVCGVDVAATKDAEAIVALDDSITDGTGSTLNAAADWPAALSRRLARSGIRNVAVINAGIAGNCLLSQDRCVGATAISRLERDVLAPPMVATVIVLEGINDIGLGNMTPYRNEAVGIPANIVSAYRLLVARAHAKGLRVVAGTLTPMEGCDMDGVMQESQRQAVNRWLRSAAGKPGSFDGLIDFDAILRDPDHPQRLLPLYDSGDHLHPNDAGYAAMAEGIDFKLLH